MNKKYLIISICLITVLLLSVSMLLYNMIECANDNNSKAVPEKLDGKDPYDATEMTNESFEKQTLPLSYDTALSYEQFLCCNDNMSWEVAERNAERFYDQAFEYMKKRKKNANADSIMCKRIVDYTLSCNRSDGAVAELECGAFYLLFKGNDRLCRKLAVYMKANGLSESCQSTIWYRIAFQIDLEIHSGIECYEDKVKTDSAMNVIHWKDFLYFSQRKYFLRNKFD